MKLDNLNTHYIIFITMGILISFGALIKIFMHYDFSSDWFWALAGFGLIVEGTISFIKQRRFDRKYKIIERISE